MVQDLAVLRQRPGNTEPVVVIPDDDVVPVAEGGEEVAMKAGDLWRTPGGVEHSVRTGDAGAVVLDVFAPPRDEYRKPSEGFGV